MAFGLRSSSLNSDIGLEEQNRPQFADSLGYPRLNTTWWCLAGGMAALIEMYQIFSA